MKNKRPFTGNEGGTLIPARALLSFCVSFIILLLSVPASGQEVRSRAAVVMDSATGRILYAKNPDLRLMPASTTKLMTALVVLDKAKLSDMTTISKRAVSVSPTKAGFREGDRVTIETLLYAALMKSANDAAVALAEAAGGTEEQFVRMMNVKAIAIGANDTKFINPHGLPGKGQHITAYDLSKIMRQAIKYPVLKEILGTRITEVSTEAGKTLFIKNTNKLLWSDEELVGGKTGYTRQARHCFVCAGERENETMIVAILGASSRSVLWKETEDLMAFGAKVMNRSEEPVVYLAKNDIGVTKASLASLAEGDGGSAVTVKKKRNARHSNKNMFAKKRHRKGGTMLASHRPKQGGKNKRTVKMAEKSRKSKKATVAWTEVNGIQG